MDSAPRVPGSAPSADALEFVRFCYQRRRIGWPELYDEMCAVAGRGLFRGWGADELGAIGIGFALFEMPTLAALAARIVAEETANGRNQSTASRSASSGSLSSSPSVPRREPPRGPVAEPDSVGALALAPGSA